MELIIQKKNETGLMHQIYPDTKITVNSNYQLRNNIKCNICSHIPVIYKIIYNPNTRCQLTSYICYNCSVNRRILQNNFPLSLYRVFENEDNTYPELI